MLQSAIFGLGVIAQRIPNGQFTQLQQFLTILEVACKDDVEGLDEDEKDQKLLLADNSRSALAKVVIFQNDGGALVKDELCQMVFNTMLPLKYDEDEAQDIHQVILK